MKVVLKKKNTVHSNVFQLKISIPHLPLYLLRHCLWPQRPRKEENQSVFSLPSPSSDTLSETSEVSRSGGG